MSIKGWLIYCFIIVVSAILLINKQIYVLIPVLLFSIFISFKRYGVIYGFIGIALFSFFLFYKVGKEANIEQTAINSEVIVSVVKEKYIIVKDDKTKYIVYTNDIKENFEVGNKVYVNGSITKLEKDLDIDVFEFKDYLNNKRIYYEIECEEILITSDETTLSNKIIKRLTSKLDEDSKAMTLMLIFNDKSSDIDEYEKLKSINAMHLFVVSGFHISFLFTIISAICHKKTLISTCIFAFLGFIYIYLLNFSFSATRAFISVLAANILKDKLNKLDYVLIPSFIYLFVEPLIVFDYSFILTNVMVITITVTGKITTNKIIKPFITSLFCFLASLPIQLIMNYEINFVSVISNILLSYVVMGIFVCCILGMMFSFLSGEFFTIIYRLFDKLIESISKVDSTVLFGSMPKWLVVIYYVVLVLFFLFLQLKKKNMAITFMVLLVAIMTGLYNRTLINPSTTITYLNVYQGDCCIIIDSFGGGVMLIDTGGLVNYDVASKKIMPYLRYHGIRHIDKVVITHDDYDHCGALESLSNQILIYETIDDYDVDKINLGKLEFTNLNTYCSEDSESNDQSIVLYSKIKGNSFLFMGDATSSIEKQIIEDNDLSIDYLKVAHHGSKTSTCEEFLKAINPKYGIISVGANNRYKHPNDEVIERLTNNDVHIYRTDIDGSIKIKLFAKKSKIITSR